MTALTTTARLGIVTTSCRGASAYPSWISAKDGRHESPARAVGLFALTLISTGRPADAAKIELEITPVDRWSYSYLNIDGGEYRGAEVIDGKLPDMTSTRNWDASMFANGGRPYQSLSMPMEFDVKLTEWVSLGEGEGYLGRNIARGTLTGTATGGVSYIRLVGSVAEGSGSATIGDLVVNDASKVPDWLPNLRVDLEIKPVDESRGFYTTVLTVSAAPPVPEPGSIAVFLAAAGAGLAMHRRRRDRTGAARPR
jgi:hypothetical protein